MIKLHDFWLDVTWTKTPVCTHCAPRIKYNSLGNAYANWCRWTRTGLWKKQPVFHYILHPVMNKHSLTVKKRILLSVSWQEPNSGRINTKIVWNFTKKNWLLLWSCRATKVPKSWGKLWVVWCDLNVWSVYSKITYDLFLWMKSINHQKKTRNH